MSGKNTAVFGIYPTHESADVAVDTLRSKGFRNTDISVLFPQNAGSKAFGHEKGTKSAEGAVAGGGTGAVIGGALGWLAGIDATTKRIDVLHQAATNFVQLVQDNNGWVS